MGSVVTNTKEIRGDESSGRWLAAVGGVAALVAGLTIFATLDLFSSATISGYLLDCATTPCAAIAP
jgi:hypothetical protein